MVAPSRYWQIFVIEASQGRGCRSQIVRPAEEFFQKHFSQLAGLVRLSEQQNQDIQAALLSYFRAEKSSLDALDRSGAGLCLRCYISYFIKEACLKLVSQFGSSNHFSLPDLLPFVLNDDGKTQLLLDSDGKTQLILDSNGKTQRSAYSFFTVEILGKFNPSSQPEGCLASWTHYQTRQNRELKNVLFSEYGLRLLSDWALLNKAKPEHVEQLGQKGDRDLVEVFHAVYRRDRRLSKCQRGARRCSDPTNDQLNEMLSRLQERGVSINSSQDLMHSLKRVAKLLRQYDLCGHTRVSTNSLELFDPSTGDVISREFPDPHSTNDLDEIEQQELQEFCTQQFIGSLEEGIQQGLREHVDNVLKRSRSAKLAPKVRPGLQLLYCKGLSQNAIARQLEMTNQSQASRLLNPKALLNQVRLRTVERLLNNILEKARDLGLTKIPPEPDYLNNLVYQLEAFVDEQVFQQAAAEISTAKNRSMSSLYAQRLCHYLEEAKSDT
jgi:transcriptional regulator with XRE-family HTH domain